MTSLWGSRGGAGITATASLGLCTVVRSELASSSVLGVG